MDNNKYIHSILFFARNTPNLGKVKLNKLLYFLDFDHFEKYGQSVTNDTYINKDLGPVPQNVDNVLSEMTAKNLLLIQCETVIDFTRWSIIPLVPYNPDVFRPSEIAMLCEVNEKWGKLTAKEIVSASHGEAPWIATRKNEEIPYELAYYRGKFEDVSEESELIDSNLEAVG